MSAFNSFCKSAVTLLCILHLSTLIQGATILQEIHTNSSTTGLVFKADFSKPTLSQAFGGAGISYGNQNVILWASGGGIDVHYPAGSYVPSGPVVGGFGIWTNHPVNANTAVFKYSVYFPDNFNFVKGGNLLNLVIRQSSRVKTNETALVP